MVKGACLEIGLLHVDLVRELPEAKKPRTVPIAPRPNGEKPRVIDSKAVLIASLTGLRQSNKKGALAEGALLIISRCLGERAAPPLHEETNSSGQTMEI